MTEAPIQRAILDWLESRGTLHWRCSLGGLRIGKGGRRRNPMTGFPDIAGLQSGKFFTIECKSPKGVLSPEQLEWKEKLQLHGCIYIVARSLGDVELALQAAAGRAG